MHMIFGGHDYHDTIAVTYDKELWVQWSWLECAIKDKALWEKGMLE